MSTVVCFQCGQDVGHPPVLNRLTDGSNCSTCAERVLADQPPIFHMPFKLVPSEGALQSAEGPHEPAQSDEHPPEPA